MELITLQIKIKNSHLYTAEEQTLISAASEMLSFDFLSNLILPEYERFSGHHYCASLRGALCVHPQPLDDTCLNTALLIR